MTIPGGYILLSRKLIESEIYDKPPMYLKVWIYLLSRAQFKQHKKLKRGQLFTTISDIQEACSWYVGYRKETPTKSKIYRIIDWLRKTGERGTNETTKDNMIETTKATQGMVVTIVNYSYYQDSKNYERNAEQNNEQTTNEERPKHSRNNINKECSNNDKNDKNDNKNNTCSDSKSSPNPPPKFDEDSVPYKAAVHLRELILDNNPRQPVPDEKPQDLEDWAYELEKLNRLGPVGAKEHENKDYSWKEIRDIMDWCQDHNFWKKNIKSAGKFREQITRLEDDMKSNSGNSNKKMDQLKEIYQEYENEEESVDVL